MASSNASAACYQSPFPALGKSRRHYRLCFISLNRPDELMRRPTARLKYKELERFLRLHFAGL